MTDYPAHTPDPFTAGRAFYAVLSRDYFHGKLPVIFFLCLSLVISLGFYREGRYATYAWLSSDQIAILPICIKHDFPDSLRDDILVSDKNKIDHYIPLFVKSIRLLAGPDHDYLQGLNRLLLFTSLTYMWGWFLLLSIWGDRWVAAVLAFLVRGLIWPPAHELWGIAGVETMVARTLFLALLPWVLWLWCGSLDSRRRWGLTCLAAGSLSQIHPISSFNLVVCILFADVAAQVWRRHRIRRVCVRCGIGTLLILLGMLPFLAAYHQIAGAQAGVDPIEFDQALRLRLDPMFFQPGLILRRLIEPKWLLLLVLPWVACFSLWRFLDSSSKAISFALFAYFIGCFVTAFFPFVIERILQGFGGSPRFSCILIRTIKYTIVPCWIIWTLVIVTVIRSLPNRVPYRLGLVVLFPLVLVMTYCSRLSVFDEVPLLGDGMFRYLWPAMKPGDHYDPSGGSARMVGERTLEWIRQNTPPDSKFIGPGMIRVATRRSVIHDWSGAGPLIEGNPKAFVAAAERQRAIKADRDPDRQARLFETWGVDYWVTQQTTNHFPLAFSDSGWNVYDLRDRKYGRSVDGMRGSSHDNL